MATIDTVKGRSKLKARREPYFYKLGNGKHLGYRRTAGGGSWIVRYYDDASQKRAYHSLGDLADVDQHKQFDAAKELAERWLSHLQGGGSDDIINVRDACVAYVRKLRDDKRETAAVEVEARFARHVYNDPIARVVLLKLARHHVEAWRQRIAKTPAVRSIHRRGMRSNATLNRDMTGLKAALNLAKAKGAVGTDLAWAEPLATIRAAGKPRDIYLTKDQRRALIDALEGEAICTFVKSMCSLPFRPGALAAIKIADFNPSTATLVVRKDKAHAGRSIPLPNAVRDTFKALSKNKLPGAYMFTREDGEPWNKDSWKKPFKAAALAVGCPPETTMFSIRHSTITDMAVAPRADLFSVAALAGTSVAMIQKTYGHLQHDRAREALSELAL